MKHKTEKLVLRKQKSPKSEIYKNIPEIQSS